MGALFVLGFLGLFLALTDAMDRKDFFRAVLRGLASGATVFFIAFCLFGENAQGFDGFRCRVFIERAVPKSPEGIFEAIRSEISHLEKDRDTRILALEASVGAPPDKLYRALHGLYIRRGGSLQVLQIKAVREIQKSRLSGELSVGSQNLIIDLVIRGLAPPRLAVLVGRYVDQVQNNSGSLTPGVLEKIALTAKTHIVFLALKEARFVAEREFPLDSFKLAGLRSHLRNGISYVNFITFYKELSKSYPLGAWASFVGAHVKRYEEMFMTQSRVDYVRFYGSRSK